MKLPRTKTLIRLASGAACSALVACSLVLPFDELGGGTRPPADAEPEAALLDVSPVVDGGSEVSVLPNPGGGFGIFSLRVTEDAGAFTFVPVRIDTDGSTTPLGCESTAFDSEGGAPPESAGATSFFLGTHYDPKNPTRAKFVYPSPTEPGNPFDTGRLPLLLATESSSCSDATAPTLLVDSRLAVSASFSPDGERVALVVADSLMASASKLITFNTSGAPVERVIRNVSAFPDAGSIEIARPTLVPAQGGYLVYWAETAASGERVIRSHLDSTPEVPPVAKEDDDPALIRCARSRGAIRQFGIVPLFGKSAALVTVFAPTSGGFDLSGRPKIYWGDRGDGCDKLELLFTDDPDALSNDFAASPDGRFLAHTSTVSIPPLPEGGVASWAVWIGSKETGKPATRTRCSNPPPGSNDRGTYWIEGGKRITWTREARNAPSAVMVADVIDGVCSGERVVSSSSATVGYVTARTGTCAMGAPGLRPGAAWFALLSAAVLFGARRRREREVGHRAR